MANAITGLLQGTVLNQSQRSFCKLPLDRNVRLLAPAGSGKTYSILWRCRCMYEMSLQKERPDPHYLIVTFTRAAAQELEERIRSVPEFAPLQGRVTVNTLNAWGWRHVNAAGKALVTGAKERRELVTGALAELCETIPQVQQAIGNKSTRVRSADAIIDMIDYLKAMGFTHTMNKRATGSHERLLKELKLELMPTEGYDSIRRIWDAEERLSEREVIDAFFDFWKKAVPLLEATHHYTMEDQKYWPRVRLERAVKEEKYPHGATQYSAILVDEFQDINPLDLALIRTIACAYGHGKLLPITIVGDDDQAIFGWRGTTPEFILHPEKHFGIDFVTCILDTNYRSPKEIVDVSSRLIGYNRRREKKAVSSRAKGRARIRLIEKRKLHQSVETVMSELRRLLKDPDSGRIALIGRKQATLFPYQVLLNAENIPYRIDADISIYEGPVMKDLIEILWTLICARQGVVRNATEEFLRICDYVDRYKIATQKRRELTGWLNERKPGSFSDLPTIIRQCPVTLCENAEEMADTVEALLHSETVYELMTNVTLRLKGFDKDFTKKDRDNHYKEPQFALITELTGRYKSDLTAFVRDLEQAGKMLIESRRQERDAMHTDVSPSEPPRVEIVTATRSKGREYDTVIILDGSQDEWGGEGIDDIEEERRLFYVAITRARRNLLIATSESRLNSRFLLEAGLC